MHDDNTHHMAVYTLHMLTVPAHNTLDVLALITKILVALNFSSHTLHVEPSPLFLALFVHPSLSIPFLSSPSFLSTTCTLLSSPLHLTSF